MPVKKILPRARRDNLVVERVGDETLIYDLLTDRAHCLNHSASFVWEHSDGKTGTDQLLQGLKTEVDAGASAEVVDYALDRLARARLLDARPDVSAHVTRRQLVRSAAAAIPLVTSLLAPTVAMAQSAISPAQCASGAYPSNEHCCVGVGRRCRQRKGK